MTAQKLEPASQPQRCEFTNANVLWISGDVVDKIGIFSEKYTHGIADYDYSLQAVKKQIPVWLAPNVCGACNYDHGKKWKDSTIPLKQRIAWMKSPKGLAYNEYMYYIRHIVFLKPGSHKNHVERSAPFFKKNCILFIIRLIGFCGIGKSISRHMPGSNGEKFFVLITREIFL